MHVGSGGSIEEFIANRLAALEAAGLSVPAVHFEAPIAANWQRLAGSSALCQAQ
jgi:hypothetical protein